MLLGQTGHGGRGIGAGQRPGRVRHRSTGLLVTQEAVKLDRQTSGVELVIRYHHGRPGGGEAAGIDALMVTRSAGQRNEDGRQARHRELGDGAGARSLDGHIGGGQQQIHPIFEADRLIDKAARAGWRNRPGERVEVAVANHVADGHARALAPGSRHLREAH